MDQTILELIGLLETEMSDEFLLYIDLVETEKYFIVKNPVIPKQKVTSASVKVEDNRVNKKAVIHRHPSGVRSFSSTDYEYINKNNTLSILYVDGEFPEATVMKRMPCGEYLIKTFKPKIYIIFDEKAGEKAEKIFEEQRKNIEKEIAITRYSSYPYSSIYGGPYYRSEEKSSPRIIYIDDEEEDCEKKFNECLDSGTDINHCYSIYYRCLS